MSNNPNSGVPQRITPTQVRTSKTGNVSRQTPDLSTGRGFDNALNNAGSAGMRVAGGLGQVVPGGAVVSAAMNGIGGMVAMHPPATTGAYAATGITNMGAGNGGINTTVGSSPASANTVTGALPGLASGGPSGVPGNALANMNNELMASQAENMKLLQVQMAMQRENQVFTTVSNVLKTRHDTVKNSIANVR